MWRSATTTEQLFDRSALPGRATRRVSNTSRQRQSNEPGRESHQTGSRPISKRRGGKEKEMESKRITHPIRRTPGAGSKSKGVLTMNTFRITYTDGTSYETNANGTAEELKAHLMFDGGRIVSENPLTGKETIRYILNVEQIHASEATARAMLRQRSTYQLVLDWEQSERTQMNDPLPTVRGWLMDELERRNPTAFNAWLESIEISPRSFFIS